MTLFSAVLTSCEKDKDEMVYLLRTTSWGDEIDEFMYDNQNRIARYSSHSRTSPNYKTVFSLSYNNEGDLISIMKESTAESIVETFTKSDNIITIKRMCLGGFCEGANFDNINESFVINEQGLPEKYMNEWRNQKISYIYQYQNDNLSKLIFEENYNTHIYSGTITYIYDDKKSPFYHCKTPKWYLLYYYGALQCGQNNVRVIIHETNQNGNSSYQKDAFTYTYNAAGFPITRETNGVVQSTNTYIKK